MSNLLFLFLIFSALFAAESFHIPYRKNSLVRSANSAGLVTVTVPTVSPTITSKSSTVLYSNEDSSEELDPSIATLVGTGGIVANVVCAYSLYVLKTTSCGLPPGPFGLLGALEGISYLGIVGILGWSLITKVKTGSGLPAGPNGLLGAAEGLTFLTVLGGLVVAGLNWNEYGFLPGFLPNDKCFGVNS